MRTNEPYLHIFLLDLVPPIALNKYSPSVISIEDKHYGEARQPNGGRSFLLLLGFDTCAGKDLLFVIRHCQQT